MTSNGAGRKQHQAGIGFTPEGQAVAFASVDEVDMAQMQCVIHWENPIVATTAAAYWNYLRQQQRCPPIRTSLDMEDLAGALTLMLPEKVIHVLTLALRNLDATITLGDILSGLAEGRKGIRDGYE